MCWSEWYVLYTVVCIDPHPFSLFSNKPTCKKHIVPCLAGIQVRNVLNYLGFIGAKMLCHRSTIPLLQYFKKLLCNSEELSDLNLGFSHTL